MRPYRLLVASHLHLDRIIDADEVLTWGKRLAPIRISPPPAWVCTSEHSSRLSPVSPSQVGRDGTWRPLNNARAKTDNWSIVSKYGVKASKHTRSGTGLTIRLCGKSENLRNPVHVCAFYQTMSGRGDSKPVKEAEILIYT